MVSVVAANVVTAIVSANRATLATAVRSVGFDPPSALSQHLMPALNARALPVAALDDATLATSVRQGRPFQAPAGVDAVLDIQIHGAGYYPAARAGGYSPMLYVVARLVSTTAPHAELARWGYDADYRAAEGELRFFTTPPALSASDADAIAANAAQVRQQMQSIAERMVQQLAIDVERRIRAQAPLP